MAINNSLAHGQRSTIWSSLGNASGLFCLSAAAMLGLGALLASSEILFNAVKIVGAGYLFYLGVKQLFKKGPMLPEGVEGEASKVRADSRQAVQVGVPDGGDQPQGDDVFYCVVSAVHRSGRRAAAAISDPDFDFHGAVGVVTERVRRVGLPRQRRADPAGLVALGQSCRRFNVHRFWARRF
jgi:hypothetical protein